jgi:hypothetical protein
MICNVDIAELLNLFDSKTAVQVVKHDYKTKRGVKYFDQINSNYPRKNWSSFIIFNCQHSSNKVLTPDFIESHDGAFLHRLSWLKDFEIGELSLDWNYLALEYPPNRKAKLIHYTLGSPCFSEFKDSDLSDFWWKAHKKSQQGLS